MSQLLQKIEEMLKQLPGGVTEGPVGAVLQKLGELQAAMDANMDSPTSSQWLNQLQAEIGKLNLGENTMTDIQNVLNQITNLSGTNVLPGTVIPAVLDAVRQFVAQLNVTNPTPETISANLAALRGLVSQIEGILTGHMSALNLNQDTIASLMKQFKLTK
ncbi:MULTISPECIES: hypothetical protein [Paenibacillus]|uniref:Uncharacterized protein n=1 Tax=Paenibacillus violae TaxID=3077234 RepID=A0ABU3R5Y5_9BACL|nr:MULTISPECIES: hypothetical protein [Paenibacillus]MDU0199676.1 hypothetical protein [Paenibacillus sp. PFR10]MEC0267770.1 hypothetical protein [Paenibacillus anseongense]